MASIVSSAPDKPIIVRQPIAGSPDIVAVIEFGYTAVYLRRDDVDTLVAALQAVAA